MNLKFNCNMYNNMYKQFMRFTWDEKKRQSNLKKHGLDFKEGYLVFAGATFSIADTRVDYGEDRFATLGLLGVERE